MRCGAGEGVVGGGPAWVAGWVGCSGAIDSGVASSCVEPGPARALVDVAGLHGTIRKCGNASRAPSMLWANRPLERAAPARPSAASAAIAASPPVSGTERRWRTALNRPGAGADAAADGRASKSPIGVGMTCACVAGGATRRGVCGASLRTERRAARTTRAGAGPGAELLGVETLGAT